MDERKGFLVTSVDADRGDKRNDPTVVDLVQFRSKLFKNLVDRLVCRLGCFTERPSRSMTRPGGTSIGSGSSFLLLHQGRRCHFPTHGLQTIDPSDEAVVVLRPRYDVFHIPKCR